MPSFLLGQIAPTRLELTYLGSAVMSLDPLVTSVGCSRNARLNREYCLRVELLSHFVHGA